jgi:hypothetical protein
VLEFWNNGMNRKRKNVDKDLIREIVELCNFFLNN